MAAGLCNLAFLYHDNPIGIADRTESMGDDQHGSTRANLTHIVLNDFFRLVIEGTRGLVKNQDTRIGDERPGDGDALALSAGQSGAVLAHHGVVALRQLTNKFVGTGQLGGLHDALNAERGI